MSKNAVTPPFSTVASLNSDVAPPTATVASLSAPASPLNAAAASITATAVPIATLVTHTAPNHEAFLKLALNCWCVDGLGGSCSENRHAGKG